MLSIEGVVGEPMMFSGGVACGDPAPQERAAGHYSSNPESVLFTFVPMRTFLVVQSSCSPSYLAAIWEFAGQHCKSYPDVRESHKQQQHGRSMQKKKASMVGDAFFAAICISSLT